MGLQPVIRNSRFILLRERAVPDRHSTHKEEPAQAHHFTMSSSGRSECSNDTKHRTTIICVWETPLPACSNYAQPAAATAKQEIRCTRGDAETQQTNAEEKEEEEEEGGEEEEEEEEEEGEEEENLPFFSTYSIAHQSMTTQTPIQSVAVSFNEDLPLRFKKKKH